MAQAELTTNPTNVSITTQIQQQKAGLRSAQADYNQTRANYNAQVAAAQSVVTDAQGRVDSAQAAIANAQSAIRSAQANLDNAKARYNRTYDLYKQGFMAAQDVDDTRTTVSVQESAVNTAQGQLDAAKAQMQSAQAQKKAAQHQADIVATKGKADIEAAQAKVAQAQAALEYAHANMAQKPAYQANLAALRAAVAAAQAALKDAQANLADTVLSSPVNGFVTARYLDPGAVVMPGTPILAVQTTRAIWVTASVPEDVSHKIAIGQTATATFDALPGRKFPGKIVLINPAIDPQSRQFTVRLMLENTQNLINPGMFAHVIFTTDRFSNATVVPREAIRQGKQGPTVLVVDEGGVAHVRPVTLGAEDAEGYAITRGLQPGDKVITLSMTPVKDGQKVRIGTGAQEGTPS